MWGASNAGWACARDKTFAEAEAICQAAGARLCTAAELAGGCTAGTGCQFDFELVWGVSAPQLPPSTPPPAQPAPAPPSTAEIVVTLTASGSIDDFPDTSSVQRIFASAAGVNTDVAIAMAPGSVIITATIAVPASTTADAMQTSLVSNLGTTAAASKALGITIVEKPSIIITIITSPPLPRPPPSQSRPPVSPPIATTTSLLTKDDAGAQVDFTAILIGGAAAAVALLTLFFASRCVPSAPRARCVSQPAPRDWPVAPTAQLATTDVVICVEQAVVEGLRPRRRQGIWIGIQV